MKPLEHQSALDAARGSAAAQIHELGLALYVGGGLILVLVLGLALYGVYGAPGKITPKRWLLGGGVAFPVVVLAALFIYAWIIGETLHAHRAADALRIHVTARQWWWEVHYEQHDGRIDVAIANELHIPVDRPVDIFLTTGDVIHSFWVPSLAGKVDMIPGRVNHLQVHTREAGIYRGQCAEYCGAQHALMAFHVIAEPEDRFETWLTQQSQAAALPTDPALSRGRELFFRGGCAGCHAIRGTEANGKLGPDLTHIGSRRSLAAGSLSNHIGTMAGWIAGAQDLKPGSLMPNADSYTGLELRTLSAWLEALK
jgi:cytochrome c oxidase subunit II